MGIHGLSFFVKSFPTLVDNQKWEIKETKPAEYVDHFIIDGNAFVYHIAFENRTNWTHGGQYTTIADVLTQTVKTFHRAGIQLTFLFDGALPQDKIETRLKRHKSYIERCASTIHNLKQINASYKNEEDGVQYYGDIFLIPPLTLEVVIQTLKELKVTVKICQSEADGEVVTMANEKMAYVVSQDSDMHVYPHVGKGYISLEQLKVPLDKETRFIAAGVCHPEALANLLNLDAYHLPLVGTLLGNDYLEADVIRFPINQWCTQEGVQTPKGNQHWPKLVAEFIRRNKTEGDDENLIKNIANQLKPIISKSNLRSREDIAITLEDRLYNSIIRYDMSSPLLKNRPNSTVEEHPIDTICDQSTHYRGKFSRQVLDVMKNKMFWTSIFIEDLERECSWNVSRALREVLYGAILSEQEVQTVDEYVREKQHLEAIQVQGKLNVEKTKQYFYQCHSCSYSDLSNINAILHPTILCLRYMIYHCSKSLDQGRLCNYEVIAMIIASLKSLSPVLDFDIPSPKFRIPALKKRSIHLAAQYQSTIYSSYLLSQILDIPNYLQLPHVLAHLFQGTYFHYYIDVARGGSSIGRMLHDTSTEFKELFCTVYEAVIQHLDQEIDHVFDYGTMNVSDYTPKRLNSQTLSSRPEKKKKSSSAPLKNKSNNAFNVLSFGCNFDE